MSLNKKNELSEIAKVLCRELRKNSTFAEKVFWEKVRNRKFLNKKFYRQYPIFYDITGKESFFIADFYCHEEKLVIELDGVIHNYKIRNDLERTKIINMLGLRILRFKNEDVINNLDDVLKHIQESFFK